MARLGGKVAVITGAAGGIRREAAILFSEEGARVCVADMGVEAGEKAAAECRDAFFFKADVSDPKSVQAMYAATEKRYGRIDVLYNNAGIMPPDDDSILITEPDAWDLRAAPRAPADGEAGQGARNRECRAVPGERRIELCQRRDAPGRRGTQ